LSPKVIADLLLLAQIIERLQQFGLLRKWPAPLNLVTDSLQSPSLPISAKDFTPADARSCLPRIPDKPARSRSAGTIRQTSFLLDLMI
jgi:hypothetical protein